MKNNHYLWNHYHNIQQSILWKKPNLNVVFTEKIDGSNLSIHIKKTEDDWNIVCLHGRNVVLWTPDNEKNKNFNSDSIDIDDDIDNDFDENNIELLSYGNVGELKTLPYEMEQFAIKVARRLKVNEIIIYGEAYKYNKESNKKAMASWHPFGYKLPRKQYRLFMLNSNVHKLFSEISEISEMPINTHEEMVSYLQTRENHSIFPPPVVYRGNLYNGLKKIYHIMKTNNKTFEGCFITSEEQGLYAVKWKVGLYEEQQKIPKIINNGLYVEGDKERKMVNQKMAEIYPLLEEIFKTKPKKIKQMTLDDVTRVAFDKEKSKMHTFKNLKNNEKGQITHNIIEEIISQYEDVKLKCPWSYEEIKKHVDLIV